MQTHASFIAALVFLFGMVNLCPVAQALGGTLINPAQRSSLWRVGFQAPVNNDDISLDCGGSHHKYLKTGGKCGICGDPFDAPQSNVAGGKYAQGLLADIYASGSDFLNVTVLVYGFEWGYFEFRICAHNLPAVPVSQDCLDRGLLGVHQAWGHSKFFPKQGRIPRGQNTSFTLLLLLPPDLECSQCVLQWKYLSIFGNEIRNCADIAIRKSNKANTSPATKTTPRPSRDTVTRRTTTFSEDGIEKGMATPFSGAHQNFPVLRSTSRQTVTKPSSALNETTVPIIEGFPSLIKNTVASQPITTKTDYLFHEASTTVKPRKINSEPTRMTITIQETTEFASKIETPELVSLKRSTISPIDQHGPPIIKPVSLPPTRASIMSNTMSSTQIIIVRGLGLLESVVGMRKWCERACLVYNHNISICNCQKANKWSFCTPTAKFKNIPNAQKWCISNCAQGFCPGTHCACPV